MWRVELRAPARTDFLGLPGVSAGVARLLACPVQVTAQARDLFVLVDEPFPGRDGLALRLVTLALDSVEFGGRVLAHRRGLGEVATQPGHIGLERAVGLGQLRARRVLVGNAGGEVGDLDIGLTP
jgi:hypothetical protein